MGKIFTTIIGAFLLLGACKPDLAIMENNKAPAYDKVPTVVVKNYVNRLFIDLIGREPLDAEMDSLSTLLKNDNLHTETRLAIVRDLQFDTTFIEGDSSYTIAYFKRFYDLCKVRLLEGLSNGEINQRIGIYQSGYVKDSLNGNTEGMAEKQVAIDKLEAIKKAEEEYRHGEIELKEVYRRMIDNSFYDFINMNTFNFVNATFDDLYHRYPTQHEFDVAFDIIEYNQSSLIFGEPAQNKEDYINILTDTREFYQGMIIWAYKTLLSREPTSYETLDLMEDFIEDHDFQKVQQQIVITDEYANFN